MCTCILTKYYTEFPNLKIPTFSNLVRQLQVVCITTINWYNKISQTARQTSYYPTLRYMMHVHSLSLLSRQIYSFFLSEQAYAMKKDISCQLATMESIVFIGIWRS